LNTVELEPLCCEERLWDRDWFSREKGWLQSIQQDFPYGKEGMKGHDGDAARVFTGVYGGRARGSGTR